MEVQQDDADALPGQSPAQPEAKIAAAPCDQGLPGPSARLLRALQPAGSSAVWAAAPRAHCPVGSVSDRRAGRPAAAGTGVSVVPVSSRLPQTCAGQLLHLTRGPFLLHNAQLGSGTSPLQPGGAKQRPERG